MVPWLDRTCQATTRAISFELSPALLCALRCWLAPLYLFRTTYRPLLVGQLSVYRLEIGLMVFYGWLLLATPVFSGLVRGHLPIEVSTRGARFAEETKLSATLNLEKVEELERTSEAHAEELTAVRVELERLERTSEGDSTQPRVGSKP